MTQLVDTTEPAGPPPSDGLTLVGETKGFLKDWQRLMLGSAQWAPEQVAALRTKGRELEGRALAADVSGLAHHLQSCEQCFWNGEIDTAKLAHCLRNVSEVAWQWRQDLRSRSDLLSVEVQGHVSRDRLTIDPPTLLAPPSVEMFESSPPPASPPSDWKEPEPIDAWPQPSGLGPWLGQGGAPTSEAAAMTPPALERKSSRRSSRSLPSLADAVYGDADAAPGASSHEAIPSRRSSSGAFPWLSASLGVLAVVGVGLLVATFGGPQRDVGAAAPRAAAAAQGSEPTPAPLSALARGAIEARLAAAHRFGGIESPELADWLDAEGAELVQAGGVCASEAIGCRLLHAPLDPVDSAPRSARPPVASWLEGLELPAIGVKGDARVREVFEFHTRNAVGREGFQELLFRCGIYRERVQSELARYGMPSELLALPMVASGCVPDMESADGGRGLWQLTPAAAKAYHLRVKAEVVDERIDPAKGTDAAVRSLEDLYKKTGSWELAIAAYQIGPLALLSSLHAQGDDVGYRGLEAVAGWPANADDYVSRVQAFALILANLSQYRFEPAPPQSPEVTAPLEVPPGTRLGVVARAAGSSTTKIRELNPDMLGDRVPDWPGERFTLRVPREAEPRAREALPTLIATADHADECVPHAFDWGRQRFTNAMASRCEHTEER